MTAIDFRVSGGVASATMVREDQLNSITEGLLGELETVIDRVYEDDSIQVLVLRGTGRAFCVGLDLGVIERGFSDGDFFRSILRRFADLLIRLERAPVPVISAVNGVARAGGFELILACDLVLIADEARIGDNHTGYGVIPGGGSTQRLPRLVGEQRAKELIFTAGWWTGPQAVSAGLALRSVPGDDLDQAVNDLTDSLLDKPRGCLAAVKRAMYRGASLPIEEAVEVELGEFDDYVIQGNEARERVLAFLESRG